MIRDLFPSDMRKYNKGYWSNRKHHFTDQVNVNITASMRRGINILIDSGKFANTSEFIRFLIIKYFDEVSKTE